MISEILSRVVKAARLNGYIFLAFGIFSLVSMIRTYDGDRRTVVLIVLGVRTAIYFVPAILLLVFANRLNAGHSWAGSGIFVMAIMLFLNLLAGFICTTSVVSSSVEVAVVMMVLGAVASLPIVYLTAVCLNARPEVRHLRRAKARARTAQGGFPVIMRGPSGSMAGVKPPPAATTIRRPR